VHLSLHICWLTSAMHCCSGGRRTGGDRPSNYDSGAGTYGGGRNNGYGSTGYASYAGTFKFCICLSGILSSSLFYMKKCTHKHEKTNPKANLPGGCAKKRYKNLSKQVLVLCRTAGMTVHSCGWWYNETKKHFQ